MKESVDDLLAEYRAAYRAANGRDLWSVWYEAGWVRVRSESHGYTSKYRRAAIKEMTERLRRREPSK